MRAAIGMAHQRGAEVGPEQAAIAAAVAFLQAVAADVTGEQVVNLLQITAQIVRMSDVLKGQLEQGLAAVAEHLTQTLVDPEPVPFCGKMSDTDGRLLEGGAKAQLALQTLGITLMLTHG